MSIFIELSALALQESVKGAAGSIGAGAAKDVGAWLKQRFRENPTYVLALERANAQAWETLEMALAGNGLFNTLKHMLRDADQKGMADEWRKFLDERIGHGQGPQFRRQCLFELREARAAELLDGAAAADDELAQAAVQLARFSDADEFASPDFGALKRIGDSLQAYPSLRMLVLMRAAKNRAPSLAEAARKFFRRQMEKYPELRHGISYGQHQIMIEKLAVLDNKFDTYLQRPQAGAVAERDTVGAPNQSQWYYGQGGNQKGPVSQTTLCDMLVSSELTRDDLVWTENMREWLPIGQVHQLRDVLASVHAAVAPTVSHYPQHPEYVHRSYAPPIVPFDGAYHAPAYGNQPPAPASSLGWAIVGLIISLVPILGCVGMIFSITALIGMKKSGNNRGKFLALAGLGFSVLWASLVCLIFLINSAHRG